MDLNPYMETFLQGGVSVPPPRWNAIGTLEIIYSRVLPIGRQPRTKREVGNRDGRIRTRNRSDLIGLLSHLSYVPSSVWYLVIIPFLFLFGEWMGLYLSSFPCGGTLDKLHGEVFAHRSDTCCSSSKHRSSSFWMTLSFYLRRSLSLWQDTQYCA